MHIDFSGAALFLDYVAGWATAHDALLPPAYRAVVQRARRYSTGIAERDLEKALRGEDSPFYGLEGLPEHLVDIHALLDTMRREQDSWVQIVQTTLSRLLPEACFGPMRLTYRIGCELIRRIECTGCLEAVRRVFYLDADHFISEYRNLLER